jgi:hypothetical protein
MIPLLSMMNTEGTAIRLMGNSDVKTAYLWGATIDTRRHKPTHPTVLVALLLPLPQACEFVRARGSPARTWGSAPLFLTMLYLMVLATHGQSAQAESAAPLPGKVYRVGYSQFVDHPVL